jgi:hypothetical protein
MKNFYDPINLETTLRMVYGMTRDKQPFSWFEAEGITAIMAGIKPG